MAYGSTLSASTTLKTQYWAVGRTGVIEVCSTVEGYATGSLNNVTTSPNRIQVLAPLYACTGNSLRNPKQSRIKFEFVSRLLDI
jgi:hypothetical protein